MSSPDDPRVFFAAERTLLAWTRTAVSIMALGFVVERFGFFLEIIGKDELKLFQRHLSLLVGVTFILLATFMAGYSAWQHKRFIGALHSTEIPERYNATVGIVVNGIVTVLGAMLTLYVLRSFV